MKGDKIVVLGFSTKDPKLEDPGLVKSRIVEAARFAPAQSAISPQCGFSNSAIDLRSLSTTKRKLAMMVDVARSV